MGGGTALGVSSFGLESKNESPPSELKVLERSPRSNVPSPPREEVPPPVDDDPVVGVAFETGREVTLEGDDFGGDVTLGGDITLAGPCEEALGCWWVW